MRSHIESSSQIRFMTQRRMPITGQSRPISQREFKDGSCLNLSRCDKLNGSCAFMQLFTIYSILAVTLFQLGTIGFSGCVLLSFGITLQRYRVIGDICSNLPRLSS